ncbi:MAG: ABC transporter permease [Lachnospiraceae bacterium]|nr:ABC transporter permease [Lachnospiraceae bacterium]
MKQPDSVSSNQQSFLRRYRRHRYKIMAARCLLLLVFLLFWEFAAKAGLINDFIFSSPSRMFHNLFFMLKEQSLFYHILITIGETLLSFLIVSVLSLLLAALLWSSETLYETLEPALVMLNSLPKSALAPVLIVWLGNNVKTVIVTGVLLAVFASTITLTAGFYKTDPDKIRLMQTLGARKQDILRKLLIPASVPLILSTMKVNIGLCLVGVIIGEFLTAKAGLGYLIIYSSQVFQMDTVMLSILILCLIAILMYQSIAVLSRKNTK